MKVVNKTGDDVKNKYEVNKTVKTEKQIQKGKTKIRNDEERREERDRSRRSAWCEEYSGWNEKGRV